MSIKKILTLFVFVYTASCETCDESIEKCVKISECPSAIQLRKEGRTPKPCGFVSQEPLVCCENLINVHEPFPPRCREIWMENKVWRKRKPRSIIGVGGINSIPSEFPYMAALGYDDENNETVWECGGSLITREHVLTAAHCVYSKVRGAVKYVELGVLKLKSNKDIVWPQSFEVIQRIRHPDYHPPSPYNDLAIIKLDKPCRISPFVIPACLNTKKELPNEPYSATGWGQLGYGEDLADHLQNMIISLYNHSYCQEVYSSVSKRRLNKGIDEETQVCAGAPGIDTCPGDSGGPLQLRRRIDNTVYGVTSFGVACGISKIPGVYIKVSPYISWIKSIILP